MANWFKKLFGGDDKVVSENQPISSNQPVAEAMPEMTSEKVQEVIEDKNAEGAGLESEVNTYTSNISSEESSGEELSTKTE